jgi:hypothetical protein
LSNHDQAEETDTVQNSGQLIPSDLAPVLFIDGLEGFVFNDHVVKFNAVEAVVVRATDQGTIVQQRTLAHLVVTHTVLDQIYHWLGENIARKNEQAIQAAVSREAIDKKED